MNPNNSALYTQDNANPGAQTKETEVNEAINESLAVAAPFIPGGAVAAKIASLTGLAPAAVHLGFVFAHLFSHPAVQTAMASAPAPAPTPAIDPVAAAAASAELKKQMAIAQIQKQMADLQAQLAAIQ